MFSFGKRSAKTCIFQNAYFLTQGLKWLQKRTYQISQVRLTSEPRINPLQIQMICEKLRNQIFSKVHSDLENKVKLAVNHLAKHKLLSGSPTILPEVYFELPKLTGENIDDHFCNIAQKQIANYVYLLNNLQSLSSLPAKPKEWSFKKGWTRYNSDGSTTSVPYPEDQALIFDVECLMMEGNYPTLATAVSHQFWYSWCSDYLIEEKFKWSTIPQMEDLIPLESKQTQNSISEKTQKERIVVGHNVGFDRSFVKEQYFLKGTKLRFLDTMSLHIATVGFTTFQRMLFQANKNQTSRSEVRDHLEKHKYRVVKPNIEWMDTGTMNNLNDVYQFHCKGPPLEKSKRDVFVSGTMKEVREQFQSLVSYCAQDVIATHAVFSHLWTEFLERFPHPVTLSGMLEMGTAFLPVNQNWDRYQEQANDTYNDLQRELKLILMQLADDACELLHEEKYKEDVWLWDLDWSTAQFKLKKETNNKRQNKIVQKVDNIKADEETEEDVMNDVFATASRLPKRLTHKPGYPNWYRELCPRNNSANWNPGPSLITSQLRIAPKLLRLTWDGYPVHYDNEHGWGYLVPKHHVYPQKKEMLDGEDDRVQIVDENEPDDLDNKPKFPLKQFLELCNENTGTADEKNSSSMSLDPQPLVDKKGMDAKERNKHWKNVGFRWKFNKTGSSDRTGPFIVDNIPAYFFKIPHKDGKTKRVGNPLAKDYINKIGDGTLMAFAGNDSADAALRINKMCSYWKNNQQRIESQMVVWAKKAELPLSVIRHKDYLEEKQYGAIIPRIVQAGTVTRRAVEPTWLTASNAYEDRIGSELKAMVQSPPGYCFVGADVDSQELWIASIIADSHFAQMHGCTALSWMNLQGKKSDKTDMHSKTAELVDISRDHAKMFNYGRIYGAGQKFAEQLLMQFNHRLSQEEAQTRAKKLYLATKGQRDPNTGEWRGGSESYMFNKLEQIAKDAQPSTPVLGCRISKALEPEFVSDDFMTSRINWVVQSSAVDYLHLMLVSMKWLMEEFSINGRFCISIHDEVRYLIQTKDQHTAALALQITNLFTRSLFAYKLGMFDLPQSVAFFSSVDIDTCLRKEVDMDCLTPSNPHGLKIGYNIPLGESLDIYQLLEIIDKLKSANSTKKQKKVSVKAAAN